MSTGQKALEEIIRQVADDVTRHVLAGYPDEDPYLVLQGMWLAMQMVGSPVGAASALSYCAPRLS